jgi:hypothetical protein
VTSSSTTRTASEAEVPALELAGWRVVSWGPSAVGIGGRRALMELVGTPAPGDELTTPEDEDGE